LLSGVVRRISPVFAGLALIVTPTTLSLSLFALAALGRLLRCKAHVMAPLRARERTSE
jgi:hypothetical protein